MRVTGHQPDHPPFALAVSHLPHVLIPHIPTRTPGEEAEKIILPDREESIANAEGQLLDESGSTEALLYSKMYDNLQIYGLAI